jgi:hypothetical protein
MSATLSKEIFALHDSEVEALCPGRLWSLYEMLSPYAFAFLRLGQDLSEFETTLAFTDQADPNDPSRELTSDERAHAIDLASRIIYACTDLDMPVSLGLVEDMGVNLPKTRRELTLIMKAIHRELNNKKFLFIPSEKAKYYDILLQPSIAKVFPTAAKELVSAGNCFACSLYTACVFHSMRAAEIGMRALGKKLDVSFPDKPLELAEWQNILDQCESKIGDMKNLRPKMHKDEELHFYSQAAVQFRYFKDAWRVRVAHARETYEERPALSVFNHTREFFETLSIRLKEDDA